MLKSVNSCINSLIIIVIAMANSPKNTLEADFAPLLSTTFNMRLLFLPFDLKPGTIVYRLRAYDADNDELTFGIREIEARQVFQITSSGSYEADVVLRTVLQRGATYNMHIYLTDGEKATEVESTVKVTDAHSKQQVFQSQAQFVDVPEDAIVGRKVSEVYAKRDTNWTNPPTFELRGSRKFKIKPDFTTDPDSQTVKAEILVNEPLDYETKNFYQLTVIALNGYHEDNVDTRNVATLDVAVVIGDVQDTAPSWEFAPPVTRIQDNLNVGEKVMKLKAVDGDKGDPRNIEYSFGSPTSPWMAYFNIIPSSGELTLKRPIEELRQNLFHQGPMILPVTATEILPSASRYPAMSNSVEIGFVLVDGENHPPEFASDRYVGYIYENSPAFTPVEFKDSNYIPRVIDNDQGSNGTFQLFLDGVDAFEVSPTIGSHDLIFTLRVKNTAKIDYEKTNEFSFKLVAKELKKSDPLKESVDVVVFVIDENDHKPEFLKDKYETTVAENAPGGTKVIQVQAADADSGSFGVVKYTKLTGPIADMLILDRDSGLITIRTSEGLDRETKAKHELMVEARDDDGNGQTGYTELVISLEDANDNEPIFPAPKFYIGILNNDFTALQQPVVIKAFDNDEPNTVNSDVEYQIIGGSEYSNKFKIDQESGTIYLSEPLRRNDQSSIIGRAFDDEPVLITLNIRAHDKGIPVLKSEEIPVYIHTQAYMNRSLNLILPESLGEVRRRKDKYQRALALLTGANVRITDLASANRVNSKEQFTNATAWAAYSSRAVIDVQGAVR